MSVYQCPPRHSRRALSPRGGALHSAQQHNLERQVYARGAVLLARRRAIAQRRYASAWKRFNRKFRRVATQDSAYMKTARVVG